MTKAVFIATAEPYSGKSIVALGLVNLLLGQARKVGYFKPIIDHDPAERPDANLDTITRYFRLPLPPADTYALYPRRGLAPDGSRRAGRAD